MTEAPIGSAAFGDLMRFWGLDRAADAQSRVARLSVDAGRAVRGRLVSIEFADEVRPPWVAAGKSVRLWSESEPREWAGEGHVLAWLADGAARRPLVVERAGGVEFLFDADQTLAAILGERYLRARRPLHTLLPLPYQRVPGPIRLGLFRLMTSLSRFGRAASPFPDWPIEPSVESIRWLFLAVWRRMGGEAPGGAPTLWPEGRRYAFVLSHDVDTAAGLARVGPIAALEAEHGFTSTWFVVGNSYRLDGELLGRLRERGHEIALHGDRHDNRIAYLSEGRIAKRLASCAEVQSRYAMRGFRSPSLLSSAELRRVVARSFEYTSETPDCEVASLIAPRRGSATCFPFEREGLLELPITLPMEDKLILDGLDAAGMLAVWRRKLGWIRQVGGLAQLVLHTEPHLLARSLEAYREILREVADDRSAWRGNLGDVARWWKEPRRHV